MSKYKIEVYNDTNSKLKKAWRELWSKSQYANFFNSYEFYLVCRKTFSDDKHRIYCLKYEGNIIAILPLVKSRVFGFTCYINPGERFTEKSPLLVKNNDREEIKILIDYILEKGAIRLSEVPKDIAESINQMFLKSLTSVISVNPYVDLSKDNYIKLKKKELSKLGSRIKKNKNKLGYLHINNGLEKWLNCVMDLEEESYKNKKGIEIFDNQLSRKFYKNLVDICKSNVVIDFMMFNKKPFVSAIGIISKGTYYACHTCYLREYKYLVPGKMLTLFMLRKLKDDGIKIFDFVRGLTNFKRDFTKDYKVQYDIYLSKSALVNIWWKLINVGRRIKIVLFKQKYSKDYLYLFKTL